MRNKSKEDGFRAQPITTWSEKKKERTMLQKESDLLCKFFFFN